MLATLQVPLFDLRTLLSQETGRLERPSWPLPMVGTEFVRSFGPIVPRRAGGVVGWHGEHAVCEVRVGEKHRIPIGRANHWHERFRRLFFAGPIVGKFEQGWYARDLDRHKLLGALTALGKSSVSGMAIAEQYHRATTRRSAVLSAEHQEGEGGARENRKIVGAGEPLLICQSTLPLDLRTAGTSGRSGKWRRVYRQEDGMITAWSCLASRTTSVAITSSAWADGRDLRISLARWHAEAEALAAMLRLVQVRELCPTPRSIQADRLQQEILRAVRVLVNGRETHFSRFSGDPGAFPEEPGRLHAGALRMLLTATKPGYLDALTVGAIIALEKTDPRPAVMRRLEEARSMLRPSHRPPLESAPLWFCNVTESDRDLFGELKSWLVPWERTGQVRVWDTRQVYPGEGEAKAIADHLADASVILLLISASALADDRWFGIAERAMQRHRAGDATVVPILVRHAFIMDTPFAELKALPASEGPIAAHPDRGSQWKKVSLELRKLLNGQER